MSTYIQNAKTQQFLELHSVEINCYSIEAPMHRFFLIDVLPVIIKKQDPLLNPILEQLKSFYKEYAKYCKKFVDKEKRNYLVVPRKLIEELDSESAVYQVATNQDTFEYFYTTTQRLHKEWEAIRQYLKSKKEEIKNSLSTQFTEQLTYGYYFEKISNSSDISICYRSGYKYVPVKDNAKWIQAIKNALAKNPKFYAYSNMSLEDGLELDFFNASDALFALSHAQPFNRIVKYPVFSHPLHSYSMERAQSLVIPSETSLYSIAILDTTRVPAQCWLRRIGNKGATTLSFHDKLEEASSFTNKMDVEDALNYVKSYCDKHIQASVIEFKALPVRALVSQLTDSQNLTDNLNSNLEVAKISQMLAPQAEEKSKAKKQKI